ncbi:MAG: PLDc N-terminal domain-containing protein [Thomasclavelia sp.]
MKLTDILVFLLPLIIIEIILLIYTLYHIFTHEHYKRGNRLLWCFIAIIGMQFIGPVLYFILGKEDE